MVAKLNYDDYIKNKSQIGGNHGFKPVFYPDMMFDFQKHLLEWSLKKGRAAVFADCGLGKSIIELAFAENIVKKTNGNVLLLTPIAVGKQMVKEAEKFGIEAYRSRDGKIKGKITITNYEQSHHFDHNDFTGLICDESSILKNFLGKTKCAITIFARKIKYRLLATATAAPNDFIELGTSSEALGYLGYMDMLNRFFKNDQNNCATNRRGQFTEATKWRLRGHSHSHFWRWVTSWARSIRKPSDMGFPDDGFILPELTENNIELNLNKALPGMLFAIPAVGLKEQREATKKSITERCEYASNIANKSNDFCILWCNRNAEGDLLKELIPDSVQVSGSDSDESKEDKLSSFSDGKIRVLITKPKIGAWGLNWQHCNHTIFFPTHSYEQYYQAIRRFLRFGQKRSVTADIIYTDSDIKMIENLNRKKIQADEMFDKLVSEMNNSLSFKTENMYTKIMEVPKWLRIN